MEECVNTGHMDGLWPATDVWFGSDGVHMRSREPDPQPKGGVCAMGAAQPALLRLFQVES